MAERVLVYPIRLPLNEEQEVRICLAGDWDKITNEIPGCLSRLYVQPDMSVFGVSDRVVALAFGRAVDEAAISSVVKKIAAIIGRVATRDELIPDAAARESVRYDEKEVPSTAWLNDALSGVFERLIPKQ